VVTPSTFRKINLVVFNGLWYGIWSLAAFKVSSFWLMLGLVPVAFYALWHLMYTPYGVHERKLVAVVLMLSLFWEWIWHSFDILRYSEPGLPFWIIAMWVNFSLSLAHCWWPWIRTPLSGILLGLAAGLLPYFAAEKIGCVHVEHREILLLTWVVHATIITRLLSLSMDNVKNSKS
jgi:hypothetical protein